MENIYKIPLFEDFEESVIENVIGVVFNESGHVLMGESTANDDRNGYLCFPGGSIKNGETPHEGCAREVKEETGLTVDCWDTMKTDSGNMFIKCKCTDSNIKPNDEFVNLDWYDPNNLPTDGIYPSNMQLLKEWRSERTLMAQAGLV